MQSLLRTATRLLAMVASSCVWRSTLAEGKVKPTPDCGTLHKSSERSVKRGDFSGDVHHATNINLPGLPRIVAFRLLIIRFVFRGRWIAAEFGGTVAFVHLGRFECSFNGWRVSSGCKALKFGEYVWLGF